MDETEYIKNALILIDYELVDDDNDFFINYVLYNHYNINEPLYNEYRTKTPTYFKTLYNSIKPFL